MNSKHLQLGHWAEKEALQFLEAKGMRLIMQNYRAYVGEIDLIMQDQEEIVFVEVKCRSRTDFGSADEAITKTKINKLIKTATLFLQQKGWLYTRYSRFDVIAIHLNGDKKELEWIKNAFSCT